jgi:hypothetical protein
MAEGGLPMPSLGPQMPPVLPGGGSGPMMPGPTVPGEGDPAPQSPPLSGGPDMLELLSQRLAKKNTGVAGGMGSPRPLSPQPY